MRKFAPDRRPDLRYRFGRTEPIEARHQRGVQACGNRERWRGDRRDHARRRAAALGLQHRLRHLFHEQRDAVGAFDDVLSDVGGKHPVAGDLFNQGDHLARGEPIDRERRHMWTSDPGRGEFRPERHEQENP